MTGAIIASRIAFPEWPQVPQGTVRTNTGNPRLYRLNLQVNTAEDIREYRNLANQILDAVAGHLTLPNLMIENIRQNCIEIYDMTRPPSKNPVYRRWQEYGAAPTLHDAVGMYSIGLGRFHPRFKEALRQHGQLWLIWSGGMRPILGPRHGNIRAHDAAIRPTGQIDPVIPYKPPHRDSRIAMQEAYGDRFGHLYNDNPAIHRQLERIDEVVEASQARGQLIPAVRYQKN
ncbi:hypothetical protein PFICI_13182 [Pestalotiopsis fici W106-1]|uniref:Uncharacterized protein n=1 Tax=Pestalotiopsis fici (strain W106-1 / CGMCC3.15140) TaxID=1229662 RepID=W3WLF5_PESFW|nr:uncharacterized protein PFICI_13182 [Pestalotiopsis fici W106-1]ETS74698.1 hypothetical protein PFICI_13182 [Pestalotiopsis fici W106-1]